MSTSKNQDYFDHDADIGIIGRGHSIEASFISAAKALFGLMADLSHIHPEHSITIEFHETDLEFALITWLNQLIAQADAKQLVLSEFSLKKHGDHWLGTAQGEAWRPNIERGIDVKGATLTMLSVKEQSGQWEARCVVDV